MSGPEGEAEGRLRDQAEILSAAEDLFVAKTTLEARKTAVLRLARRLVADPLATDDEAVTRALEGAARDSAKVER